jgi:hypothetical protein
MDGKFCALLHLALAWREEDGPFSHLNQHTNLTHGFLLNHIQSVCGLKAMEAPFFGRETALQLPEPRFPREYIILKEFVAEEDLHQGKKDSVDAVDKDDNTVHTSNSPPPSG